MSRSGMVDYYLEKSKNPEFQIDQIRKELEENNVPEEEIRVIVRLVDNDIQKRALVGESNSKSSEIMIAGIILTIVGSGITLGTYTGLIDMGNSFLIVYGPFFAGLSMYFAGLAQRRKSD